MKLIMESWRRYLNEETERGFMLLLEGELNESAFQKAKDWFSKMLKAGKSKSELGEKTDQIKDPSRREFLRKALGAAVVISTVGIPSQSFGASKDQSSILNIIKATRQEIKKKYSPKTKAGQRIRDRFLRHDKSGKQEKRFYQILYHMIDNLRISEMVDGVEQPLYRDISGALAAVGVSADAPDTDDKGSFTSISDRDSDLQWWSVPAELVLSNRLPWENEEEFMKSSPTAQEGRQAIIYHEFIHVVDNATSKFFHTSDKGEYPLRNISPQNKQGHDRYNLSRAQRFELEKIFKFPQYGSDDDWERKVGEYYAEFISYRSQIEASGRDFEMRDLEQLCKARQRALTWREGDPDMDLPMHMQILLNVRCPPSPTALVAAQKLASNEEGLPQSRHIAESNSIMEGWRRYINEVS